MHDGSLVKLDRALESRDTSPLNKRQTDLVKLLKQRNSNEMYQTAGATLKSDELALVDLSSPRIVRNHKSLQETRKDPLLFTEPELIPFPAEIARQADANQ